MRSLGWEDPLKEGMATHSRVLAWKTLWPEEPGGLQYTQSQRVRHDLANGSSTHSSPHPHTHTASASPSLSVCLPPLPLITISLFSTSVTICSVDKFICILFFLIPHISNFT